MKKKIHFLLITCSFHICTFALADQALDANKTQNQTIAQISEAAEKGDIKAQANLGLIYVKGKIAPQDYKQGISWLEKAATQGEASAQLALGILYLNGQGVSSDTKKAIEWYVKAAENGSTKAQYSLGLIYSQGKFASPDDIQTFKWLKLAALGGDVAALNLVKKLEGIMPAPQIAAATKQANDWKSTHQKKLEVVNEPKENDSLKNKVKWAISVSEDGSAKLKPIENNLLEVYGLKNNWVCGVSASEVDDAPGKLSPTYTRSLSCINQKNDLIVSTLANCNLEEKICHAYLVIQSGKKTINLYLYGKFQEP